jgi:hypothetical protein
MPKKGYDGRLNSYLIKDAPTMERMSAEQAKELINEMFAEFCFETDTDKIQAIAALITPACRGLYCRTTARTPITLIMANREGAGKDYLAGCIDIVYEGEHVENPPICTDDKFSNSSEELRKKLTAALKHGRRRIHFGNNRGNLRNAVLEQFATAEVWRDRELGKNIELTLNNEVDISLSANVGITYTPDFWRRCRPINLSLDIEDVNSRRYQKPDLHGWVKENRGRLLSALNSLILDWYENGKRPGNTPFSGFPEWGRVVGGVMQYHELGDPCLRIEDNYGVGGDEEGRNMKMLWELLLKRASEAPGGNKEFSIQDIRDIITTTQGDGEGFFEDWNFSLLGTPARLGKLMRRHKGRIHSGIRMTIKKNSGGKSERDRFSFTKV